MKTSTWIDSHEVRSRAAEVRKQWTLEERQRRIGLPPDTPTSLRQFILGNPVGGGRSPAYDAVRGRMRQAAN